MRRPPFARIALGLGLMTLACASSPKPSADATQKAMSSAAARMEGGWTLVEFQPAQPLEPMLQNLLNAQLNQLTVTFHAGTMSVQGVGVDAERAFNVTTAANDEFSATLTDPTNVVYQVNAIFDGPDVDFTSVTDPWRGRGKLRRAR
ncbi:MAG TPA: hypothetical protein VMI54_09880 [Polyangiaceae bacterium]|nr:hypothetical protein [Polyangiaceae bacterium]